MLHATGDGGETEMRRLSGLDAVFLAAEGPANYVTHGMAVMVLDPSTMQAGDRVLTETMSEHGSTWCRHCSGAWSRYRWA